MGEEKKNLYKFVPCKHSNQSNDEHDASSTDDIGYGGLTGHEKDTSAL